MHRMLISSALVLMGGIFALHPHHPALATASVTSAGVGDLIAQEPNQDSLEMTCNGSISVRDINYTVFFTREAGFSRITFSRRSNGQQIAEAFLSYDKNNDKGQAVWRGSVNDMANVTLVHLANRPARPGDQVSVKYDGQWGRGTCNRR